HHHLERHRLHRRARRGASIEDREAAVGARTSPGEAPKRDPRHPPCPRPAPPKGGLEPPVGSRTSCGEAPNRYSRDAPCLAGRTALTIENLPCDRAAALPARSLRPHEQRLTRRIDGDSRMLAIGLAGAGRG